MTRSNSPRKLVGVVLAGGRGTRLFGPQGGPKCLFNVNERPLLDYSLSAIRNAGVDEIALVAREDDLELQSKYSDLALIPDTGNGTFFAILAAAEYAVGKRSDAIISSCDLVCAPTAAKALVDSSFKDPDWLATFGVTLIANDQNPIWVHTDRSGRILNYGKEIQASEYAFASIRYATFSFLEAVIESAKTATSDINTDTKLMRYLMLSKGVIAGAIDIGRALDVDDDADAKIAEDISRSFRWT